MQDDARIEYDHLNCVLTATTYVFPVGDIQVGFDNQIRSRICNSTAHKAPLTCN